MKNTIIAFLTAIAAAFLPTGASAQKYVLDDNFQDSVQVYEVELTKNGAEVLGNPVFKLPMGQTVFIERTLKDNSARGIIKIDGKEYAIGSGCLLFSDENPDGVEDTFGNTRERTNHSWSGKFYATPVPYVIVVIAFLVSIIFTFLGLKVGALRSLAIKIVPACLLVAAAIEIHAFMVLGSDAFWWCDKDRYGFFGSLFRAIPFVGFVAFQFYSVKLYERLLLGDETDEELSIKPMAISLAICIPVFLVLVFGLTALGLRGTLRDVITIVGFLATLTFGIVMSLKKNVALLGKAGGTAFTVFGIVYIIGSLIAAYGLILIILKLIIQILIICAAIVGVGFAMSNGSGGGGDHQMYFVDKDGGRHTNGVDCEAANKRIEERKAGSM